MKDLDPLVFLSVFQEMLGPLLWVLVALAVVGLAAFAVSVVRERKLVSRRLVWAELLGLAGGFAAIGLMWGVTHSSLADAGGPIDWVLVAVIFVTGWVGTWILTYGLWGLIERRAA